jgi:hypothetical protein
MTSPNLELVRSIYTSWERGAHRYWADPQIQYVTVGVSDSGARHGAYAVESFRGWLSAEIDWKATAHNYLELDRERVLVPYRVRARAKAQRPERGSARMEGATLFELREHRVTRIIQYFDHDRAFAELGLAPPGKAADSSRKRR